MVLKLLLYLSSPNFPSDFAVVVFVLFFDVKQLLLKVKCVVWFKQIVLSRHKKYTACIHCEHAQD